MGVHRALKSFIHADWRWKGTPVVQTMDFWSPIVAFFMTWGIFFAVEAMEATPSNPRYASQQLINELFDKVGSDDLQGAVRLLREAANDPDRYLGSSGHYANDDY